MVFIVWIAFILPQQKTNVNFIKINVKLKIFITKILEFNQYQKSDKVPFIIYAGLEYIMEKIDGCKSNPENSFTR